MKKTLLAFALSCCFTIALAASADDIKSLLESGRDVQAYDLARGTPQNMGDPLFDFYFGIAAINAGFPGEGVLALERYLLYFPDNRSAQFHLARGYFTSGEDLRARDEFRALAVDAQGDELASINRFLETLKDRESRRQPVLAAWVEAGIGRDNNINSGVVSGQIAGLPDGLVVLPGQSSEKRADAFSTLTAGIQGSFPVRSGLSVYGGMVVTTRKHAQSVHDVFDQNGWGVYGGITRISGRHLNRVGVDAGTLNVFHQSYLKYVSVVGEWQYQPDQFNRLGGMVQWSRQSFQNITSYLDIDKTTPVTSASDVRDSDITNLTGMWRHGLLAAWNPTIIASVNVGQEKNRRERPDLGRNFLGLKVAATVEPVARWTMNVGMGWQQSRYGAEFSSGLETRRDNGLSADLSVIYALDRNWSLRTEFVRLDQRSNIGLYKYTRDAVALKVRYDLR